MFLSERSDLGRSTGREKKKKNVGGWVLICFQCRVSTWGERLMGTVASCSYSLSVNRSASANLSLSLSLSSLETVRLEIPRTMTNLLLLLLLLGVSILLVDGWRRSRGRRDASLLEESEFIRDNYGCDAVISSCGQKGQCCDQHDACYKRHGCTAISWFYLCKISTPSSSPSRRVTLFRGRLSKL